MFKRISFSFFFLIVNALVFAQGVVVVLENRDSNIGKEFYGLNVNVFDNFTGHSIKDVKAYLMTKDSVMIDSLQSANGRFSFKVKRDKGLRSCILKMTHPTYQTLYSAHSLRQVGKQIYFSLPDQFMKRKNVFNEKTLNEVVITATKIKMYYRGDTLRNPALADLEVDFIVVRDGEVTAIEVKSGRRGMNSGLPEFIEAFHPKRSFVVGTDGVSIEDFLSCEVEEII